MGPQSHQPSIPEDTQQWVSFPERLTPVLSYKIIVLKTLPCALVSQMCLTLP